MSKRLDANELGLIFDIGENDQIEFKYGTLVPNIIAKCIAAFANTKGGKIIIGYSERRKVFVSSSWKDEQIIINSLKQLEDTPNIDYYNMEYNGKLLLIIDVEKNEGKLTYYQGALYERVDDENRLMGKNRIKSTLLSTSENLDNELLSVLEKMNMKNEELRNKLDEHNVWAVENSKNGFRWAIVFCVVGAILGAIIGTILSKIFFS